MAIGRVKMRNRWGLGLAAAVAALVALTAACSTDLKVEGSSVASASGQAECDACHPGETRTWRATYHAMVARAPHASLLKEAAQYWSMDGKGNAGPSRGNVDGKPYGFDDVEMVVGTRWKQRFLVKNEATGHHQFLDKQWNSYTGVWEAYANKDDWDAGCANCHGEGGEATRIVVDARTADH
jgi:cytochrome c553